jgi:hypothetical protein
MVDSVLRQVAANPGVPASLDAHPASRAVAEGGIPTGGLEAFCRLQQDVTATDPTGDR